VLDEARPLRGGGREFGSNALRLDARSEAGEDRECTLEVGAALDAA
jgi:hypothetical protein